MAQIYMNTDRANQAEKILQEIVQDQRSFGPAYRLLGSVYKILGNTSLGEEYIIQAGDLLDYKPPVDTLIDRLSLISRSDTYILKQIDEAERSVYPEWALMLAANALRYMPENHYLISKYSKLLLTLGSGKQAQPYLNKHLSYFREDFNEIKQVGDMLYDKGFYTESTDYFKRALELRPDDADVKASLVLSFLNAGNQQQGLDLLQGELDRTPGDPKLLANAVYIMLAINDQASAGSYLSRLMRVAPASPKTFRLRALIAEHDGNLQVAIAMYESALKGNPGDLVSIQSLDEILRRQKLWNRDILLLKEALKSHPNEPYLLEKLGTLLVACPDTLLRDYRQGLKYAQRAFINKASTPEIMFSAGRSVAEAYAALGDNDSARLYLKHILELAEGQHAPEEFIEELQTRLKQI
jgi:tetratricopeptide (TPR) repeat protein